MAMAFALQCPSLVEALVVVDIAPLSYKPGPSSAAVATVLRGISKLDLTAVTSMASADALMKPAVPDAMLRAFALQNLVPNDTGGFKWRLNVPVLRAWAERLMAFPGVWRVATAVLVDAMTPLLGRMACSAPTSACVSAFLILYCICSYCVLVQHRHLCQSRDFPPCSSPVLTQTTAPATAWRRRGRTLRM